MTPLDEAITILNAEIAGYNAGTTAAPKPSSPEWFVLRAKTLAISHLKRMKQLGLDGDPSGGQAENHYRSASRAVKGDLPALLDPA